MNVRTVKSIVKVPARYIKREQEMKELIDPRLLKALRERETESFMHGRR